MKMRDIKRRRGREFRSPFQKVSEDNVRGSVQLQTPADGFRSPTYNRPPKDRPLSRAFVQGASTVLMQMNFDGGLLTDYKILKDTTKPKDSK